MKNGLFISAEIYAAVDAALSPIIQDIHTKIDEKNFDVSKYSDTITDIGIIINCFPDEYISAGWGKPRKYISYQKGSADIRLPLPYVDFRNAEKKIQYLMAVKNIITSIEIIGERCAKSKRAQFNSDNMIADILHCLKIEKEELADINGVIQNIPEA